MYFASSASSVTEPSWPLPFPSSSADSALTSMLSDCPPSKPISIRTCSAMCHHLRENAVDGIRMDERDLQAEHARARLVVDELGAVAPQRLERRADVLDLERDVVHPGAARGEEAPDRRVVLEGREQLHAVAPHADGDGFDALVGHRRAVLELRAEEPLVRLERVVQVLDRNAEMMDAARFHAGDANDAASGQPVVCAVRCEKCAVRAARPRTTEGGNSAASAAARSPSRARLAERPTRRPPSSAASAAPRST